MSADGNWIAFRRELDRSVWQVDIVRSDGSQRHTLEPPTGLLFNDALISISEDGGRVLLEAWNESEGFDGLWIVHRDGSDPIRVIPDEAVTTWGGSLARDGLTIAFISDADLLGNGNTHLQVFVLKGPAFPDLSVDTDCVEDWTLDPQAAYYSAGKYILPVDVQVCNGGDAPASDILVRFSDNSGWSTTQTIANLDADASRTLHLDWDITPILARGDGKATVKLTVHADADNTHVEKTELNNKRTASALVDARPRIT